ncbi:alkaline phosphatase D family protein [Natrinema halophilum]|uniref:Alkaline phosphatase D family protein n=1 Tax=Natrinema halophilum TaxID=1699371 RepID=A0A7D5GP88_9EURY|nr:alkaline phosphatase D family protein [Natrinema halophilum]QLG50173.1 alkaline phosphatase D family protein [Natrinema halophilum]
MDGTSQSDRELTEQNRRQFLQRTSAASVVSTLGLSTGTATAMTDDGMFETDPFTLGIASGDPLPDSVILWTRIAPNPLTRGGGMPAENVDVRWSIATDESMTDVVQTGTATAWPEHAHTVHVDVTGLAANTEYYYRFEAGGKRSAVGRTKTAPASDAELEEFRFGFASCQSWPDGFYTAYRYMAADELDLIVHLGDYIYEYPIGASGGVRNTSVPSAYRTETETLERYRLQYGLYKSDRDLKAAHASAPWLITRDDHEADNNWAGDVPQDPDEQTTKEFLKRQAAAFKAYYEHMPFRRAQRPDGPDQKLYRNYSFGELVEFNVLDTRQYRSDQACGDAFTVVDCQERFGEDRSILGDDQEQWLLDNLEDSTATWNVLANQLPIAKMDFKQGPEEGYRTDQWDGYVADQETVLRALEEDATNPIVITGDFHNNWATNLKSPKRGSARTVGAEFVGTSIASGGDGIEMDDFGRHVISENEHVKYYCNKRGYVRCTVTPEEWIAEYQVVDHVTEPDAPIRTDARFVVEDGVPGLQPRPTSPVELSAASVSETDVTLEWNAPHGLEGNVREYWVYVDGEKRIETTETQTTVSDLTPGMTYSFSVALVDDDGNRSPISDPLEVTMNGSNDPPAILELPDRLEAEDYHDASDTTDGNRGGAYRDGSVDIKEYSNDRFSVGWTADGEWLEYDVAVAEGGEYDLTGRVASDSDTGGAFHLEVDGKDVTGTIPVETTGGWQSWTTVSERDLRLAGGEHTLRLVVEDGSWNLDWLEFSTPGDDDEELVLEDFDERSS